MDRKLIAQKVIAKMEFKRVRELSDEYSQKWLDAVVTEVAKSKHGKGVDLTIKLDGDYPGLPPIIETEMVLSDYALSNKDKIKVKLYISPGGILVDQLNKPGASKENKVAKILTLVEIINEVFEATPKPVLIKLKDSSDYSTAVFDIGGKRISVSNADGGEVWDSVQGTNPISFDGISGLRELLKQKNFNTKKTAKLLDPPDDESLEKDLAGKLLVNLKKKIDVNLTKAKVELIKILDGKEFQEEAIREFYKSCMEAIKLLDAKGYEHWHE